MNSISKAPMSLNGVMIPFMISFFLFSLLPVSESEAVSAASSSGSARRFEGDSEWSQANRKLFKHQSGSIPSAPAVIVDDTHKTDTAGEVGVKPEPSRRRVLRDISPPGMWPPGSDAPPSDPEFLIQFFDLNRRRRALLDVPQNHLGTPKKSSQGLKTAMV